MEVQEAYYIYCLYRPDGRPCYIGKGKGNRIGDHERYARSNKNHYNRLLGSIIKQAGGKLEKKKLFENLTEKQAFFLEKYVIQSLGRQANGGPLANLTDGGEGVSGHVHSEETRRVLSEKAKGHIPWNVGIPATDETKAKQRNAKLGTKHTPEQRANRSAALKGIPRTDEWKARIGDGNRRRHAERSSEAKAAKDRKIADAHNRKWAEKRAAEAMTRPLPLFDEKD